VGVSIVLIFFVAPEDADQGISQKIFYFHVPIALTAYACFGWGALKALLYLWRREERYDLESYVGIHQGTIFGALTLVTGSIWARASWGVWWAWDSNQLVLFLVLFLFYSAYFMLRFSVEEGPRRGLSRSHVRGETAAPPALPPGLICPMCDCQLDYKSSQVGGVSARNAEQWDYFVCERGCGTFQYRQRTRKLRKV